MAAGILPKPGTKAGPCKGHCDHICTDAIGYGRSFYRSQLDGALAHETCLMQAVDRNDARAGLF